MEKTLLDTDILSEILRGKNRIVGARAARYRIAVGHLSLSSVTLMEIVRGLVRLGRNEKLDQTLAKLSGEEIVPFTATTAEIAGRIDGTLQRIGKTIDRLDPMIAATAIEHDFVLATGNTKHFQRVVEAGFPLRIEDWRS